MANNNVWEWILERKAKGSEYWEPKAEGANRQEALDNYARPMNQFYTIDDAKAMGFTFRLRAFQQVSVEEV